MRKGAVDGSQPRMQLRPPSGEEVTMQGQKRRLGGVFYPDELKRLESAIELEAPLGESRQEREARALLLLLRERYSDEKKPDSAST